MPKERTLESKVWTAIIKAKITVRPDAAAQNSNLFHFCWVCWTFTFDLSISWPFSWNFHVRGSSSAENPGCLCVGTGHHWWVASRFGVRTSERKEVWFVHQNLECNFVGLWILKPSKPSKRIPVLKIVYGFGLLFRTCLVDQNLFELSETQPRIS